jgi:hypothetical protein
VTSYPNNTATSLTYTTFTTTEIAPGYPSTLTTTLTGKFYKSEEFSADLTDGLETSTPFASTQTTIVYATATITELGSAFPTTLTTTLTGNCDDAGSPWTGILLICFQETSHPFASTETIYTTILETGTASTYLQTIVTTATSETSPEMSEAWPEYAANLEKSQKH